ncbi:piRNA biogenesis protein EXD1-like, partial [Leptodactylus fuscus]
HQYGVILNNVFDTQVADVYLFSMATIGILHSHTSTLLSLEVVHLFSLRLVMLDAMLTDYTWFYA